MTKSVAYTLLILLVPLLLLGAAGTLYYHDVIKNADENTFLESARAVSNMTDNYLDKTVLYLQDQADRAPFVQAIDRHDTAALEGKVKMIVESTPIFYWAFITDPAGNVLAGYPYDNITGRELADSRTVPGPLWAGRGEITNPVTSEISGRPTVFVSTTIVSNGTTTGVLAGGMDVDSYYEMLDRARASVPGQCIFIVNDTGRIIAHHHPGAIQAIADVSRLPPVQHLLMGEEGAMEYDDPVNGGRWLGAYARIPEFGWGVVVAQPVADAYRPVADAFGIFGVLLLLLALVAIPVAFVAGRYIARPLVNMRMAVDKVAEEESFGRVDLSSYLPYDREDELGNLARNFKYMSEKLSAARERIMGEKKRADLYIDVMGHDINNLNQAILSHLEMMSYSGGLNPKQHEYLDGAITATRESAAIIRNVRAIQAATTGKPELKKADLDQVIRGCIEEAPRPEGKKVTFRYAPREGTVAEAVPGIRLAFCNVIKNAIKYSGREVNVEIDVNTDTIDGKRYFTTAIADNGNGIPDETKQTLFSRFQADSSVPPGKGLGLYAAKVLVERSGGSIKVENRVPEDFKKGTRVIISLPAAGGPGE